jgi:hypothetical protein
MKSKEILELLQKHYDNLPSEDQNNGGGVSEFAYADEGTVPGLGAFKEIEQKGGEDQGETWYSVKHFPEQNVYVRIAGYYASYDGTSFEDWEDCVKVVRPVEKTVTVYE